MGGSAPEVVEEFAVAAILEEVRDAREWLAKICSGWGFSPNAVHVARTVVTELVTNAIKHTDTAKITLRAYLADAGPLVEVWDDSDECPVLRAADLSSVSGRGLMLVDFLTEEWGCGRRAGGGKAVFAVLRERE